MIRRYSVREIEKIFSDSNKYNNWLLIEKLLIKYLSESKGLLKKEDAKALINELSSFPKKIRDEEKRVKHDVVAFINSISETIESPQKKWIHYGLTSSDLVDTGNAIALKDVNRIVVNEINRLLRRLKNLSFKYKKTYKLKRDNGIVSGVSSFGYEISQYYSSIKEFLYKFQDVRQHVECVSISGSVGISPYLDVEFQDFVAKELNLFSTPASSQVISRERYYRYFSILNSISQMVNKLAIELRLLARTEIGEIEESFVEKQIGSSSMPHKRNPVSLENVCGLCRLMNGYSKISSQNIPIWFERDISHSSVDRVLFLDATTTFVQILRRISDVMEHLVVNSEVMKANLEMPKNAYSVYGKKIRKLLIDKEVAKTHEIDFYLNEMLKCSKEKNISFLDVFKSSDWSKKIEDYEWKRLLDVGREFSFLDDVYRNLFGESLEKASFDNIYYENSEIDHAINLLAVKLNYEYRNEKEEVQLVALRDGSVVFLSKLLLKLKFPLVLRTESMSLKKFLAKEESKISDDDFAITPEFFYKRRILVIDDLLDTGTTIDQFKKHIQKYKPKDIKTCVLFFVENMNILKKVDFYGLPVPSSEDLVGFGMDLNGSYRNLNFVGRLKIEKQN